MVKTLVDLLFNKIDNIIRFDVSVQYSEQHDDALIPYVDAIFLIEVDFIKTSKSKNIVKDLYEYIKNQSPLSFNIEIEHADDDYFKKPLTYLSLTVRPKL